MQKHGNEVDVYPSPTQAVQAPSAKILLKYAGIVPAPTMAFSLPSGYVPRSFTSRGFIFPPRSNAVDKKPLLFKG